LPVQLAIELIINVRGDGLGCSANAHFALRRGDRVGLVIRFDRAPPIRVSGSCWAIPDPERSPGSVVMAPLAS
jgi:hypothetical protein